MSKNNNKSYMFKHKNKGRFIEACLLSLLKENKSYGYNLLQDLADFGFVEGEINISIIYRNLKIMENEKLVVSTWQQSDEGPSKKVYEITEKGEEKLYNWIQFLNDRKKRINLIIKKYNSLK